MSRGLQQPKVLLLTEPGENQQEFVRQLGEHCQVEITSSIDVINRIDLVFVTKATLEYHAEFLAQFQTENRSSETRLTVIAICDAQFVNDIVPHIGVAVDDCLSLPTHPTLLKSRLDSWFELRRLRHIEPNYQFYMRMFIHDLHNRLTGLRINSEMILDESEDLRLAEIREMLSDISHSASDLYKGFEVMGELFSMERVFNTHELAIIPVKPFLESIPRNIEEGLYRMKKRLSISTSPDLPPIRGIGSFLVEAMDHLFNDIWRNTVEGGEILIGANQSLDNVDRQGHNAIHITIKDVVKNVPLGNSKLPFNDSYEDRCITPIWQYDLPLARAIILRHGGRIWIESVQDEEISFHFTLPVAS